MNSTASPPPSTPARSPVPTRRFGWFSKLLLALLSFGLMYVAADAVLWIAAPAPFHEWMDWTADGHVLGRGQPGQTFKTADGTVVRINNLGFRGPDYAWQPAAGTLRMVALGGSSTFCYHARGEENTWTGRLQRELSERLKMPVEVINLSMPGYLLSMSKINYLVTGRAVHPHVCLVYHTWNDMKRFRRLAKGPVIFEPVKEDKPLWQRVARYSQIARRVRNAKLAGEKRMIENQYTTMEKEGKAANDPIAPEAWAWERQNFVDIAEWTRADGVLPVLMSQATIIHESNLDDKEYRANFGMDLMGMTAPRLVATWKEMNALIEAVAREKDAVFVDGYGAVPHDFEHLMDHVHLTDPGAAVLAKATADTLLKDPRFMAVVERVRGGGQN